MIAVPEGIIKYIVHQIKIKKEQTFSKFRVVNYQPTELYRELLNDEQMFDVFKTATQYMKFDNFHQYEFVADQMRVEIYIRATEEFPCYLVPTLRGFRPSPESNLMQQLEISNQLAADWQTTIMVFRSFYHYDARVISSFFPWVKDIILDCDWFKSDTWNKQRFMDRIGISTKHEKIIDQVMAQLIEGKPTRAPALTPLINQACRLGKKLFAQANLLKDAPQPPNTLCWVQSIAHDGLIPIQLTKELHDVHNAWNKEKEMRALQPKHRTKR